MGPLKNPISPGSLKGIIISLNHLLRTYYSHVMMRYGSLLLGPASSSIHCVLVDSFFTTRYTIYSIYIYICYFLVTVATSKKSDHRPFPPQKKKNNEPAFLDDAKEPI